MAFLEERNGRFRVAFRHQGKLHRVALGSAGRVEAEGNLARVEEGLRLLAHGRLEVPDGADLGLFLLTDGKVSSRAPKALPAAAPAATLGRLRDLYLESQGRAVEANTLYTLRIHFKHLAETLGEDFDLARLDLAHLERHVGRRLAMPGRGGRPLNPDTARKEVRTLASAWAFGAPRKLVAGAFPPVAGLVYPKTSEKPPFRTRAEIEAQLSRGSGDPEAWASLFLTLADVAEVLASIRERAYSAWIYPMTCLAAHTGARRAELLRSRVEDVDLTGATILIREKKKERGKLTTRRVPISPFLGRVLAAWLDGDHPGGPWTFAHPADAPRARKERAGGEPIAVGDSDGHLNRALAGTRWAMIGWHTFRHSFASNCAARGVDERLIDGWMGHQTEAMRRRYRHLLPDHQSRAIRDVFAEGE